MTWRTLDHANRLHLSRLLGSQILQRLNQGKAEHGQNYRGLDPIADVQEELIDGLIYLNWVSSQRFQATDLLLKIVHHSDDPETVQELAHEAIAILQGTE